MGEEQLKHLQLTVGCVSHPAVKPHSSAQPYSQICQHQGCKPYTSLVNLTFALPSLQCSQTQHPWDLAPWSEGAKAFNSGQGPVKDQKVGSQLLRPASPSLSGHIVATWDGRKSL